MRKAGVGGSLTNLSMTERRSVREKKRRQKHCAIAGETQLTCTRPQTLSTFETPGEAIVSTMFSPQRTPISGTHYFATLRKDRWLDLRRPNKKSGFSAMLLITSRMTRLWPFTSWTCFRFEAFPPKACITPFWRDLRPARKRSLDLTFRSSKQLMRHNEGSAPNEMRNPYPRLTPPAA